ncbi:Glycosyl transferase family 2 [Enhygromyxa salina]|uniref:Glycosyl transferase family 2 n=1 Tax=Enhygromyxa salina TaxID=215803 RepID=A0A2S9YAK4_9BACT|nr:galactosyltransferase-related protein [Enhygromyxa salina]PRQ02092.1 Glycosyl transferase family 2 [Enhygromyxa salina]
MSMISIVIPWANRDELATCLAANAELLAGLEGQLGGRPELVVVDCGGDPGRCEAALVRAGVAVTLVEIPTDRFDKGLALNLGAHAAAGENLVFLDADVILDADFLPAAVEVLAGGGFATVARVRESKARPDPLADARGLRALSHVVELESAAGAVVRIETNRREFADQSRGGPGLIALRRQDFVAVDGMNSDLQGWGWEDVDLVARLQLRELGPRVAVGGALHLSHDDALRSTAGASRAHSEQHNFSVCVANYRLGHLRGTFADDVQTCADAIEIRSWSPSRAGAEPRARANH